MAAYENQSVHPVGKEWTWQQVLKDFFVSVAMGNVL